MGSKGAQGNFPLKPSLADEKAQQARGSKGGQAGGATDSLLCPSPASSSLERSHCSGDSEARGREDAGFWAGLPGALAFRPQERTVPFVPFLGEGQPLESLQGKVS